jgi:D-3-phosphoglycerate dehydrogenase
MTFRILITDDINSAGIDMLRGEPDLQIDVKVGLHGEALRAAIPGYQAVITRSGTALDATFFAAGSGTLRVAARAGVGLDNVDVQAATLAGVMVMNIPEVNSVSAAEHALALLLSLCRKIPQANARLRDGFWERQPFLGVQLSGKTLGIVGLGRVGGQVAIRARALGMDVIAFDPYVPEEGADSLHVELVEELDELLARADVISLHMQLTPETRGMIGPDQFARMQDGVILVNTARGALIDESALYDQLVSGRVAGAALDVFSTEPPQGVTSQLIALPNVVATPHLGASTIEAQADVSLQIARQVLDALRGVNFHNVVNLPFAGEDDYRAIAPYMLLAEKIGSLHMQLLRGELSSLDGMQVQVAYRGTDLEEHTKPLTVALLKGMLAPILGDSVNYVNAPRLAHDHGLAVNQTLFPGMEDYSNMIVCRLVYPNGKRLLAGTLLTRSQPRIVRLDDYPMDVLPAGYLLLIKSRDVPGVIGQVASTLGTSGLNIAEYRLGRDEPGGTAFAFINLDSEAPESVLNSLRALPPVIEVKQVNL